MKSSWDDLRYILAVAEHGSVSRAARQLGVNHATVLRHVGAYEKTREVRLFERLASGYSLTREGRELVDSLREIESRITEVERKISGWERRPEGNLRITTTDSILVAAVAPHLEAFRCEFPKIVVEVAMTVGRLDLARREADVAIRPSSHPPENIVGIEVAPLAFAVYASVAYMEGKQDWPIEEHRWLALDELLRHARPAQWIEANVPNESVAMRGDSFVALGHAAQQGLGLTILPCCYGDLLPGLVRVMGPLKESEVGLWILTHQDLRRSALVRAFIDFFLPRLRAMAPSLAGVAA